MTSNTKMTRAEKDYFKASLAAIARENFSVEFKFNPDFGLTYFIVVPFKGANVKYVSTSVASPDEKKFRKSVGKSHALNRFRWGGSVAVPALMEVNG